MLARLTQRGRESLVLGDRLLELSLGLEDLLLEGAHPLGCVLEAPPEHDDLLLETLELTLEVVDLPLVLGETPVVFGSHAITSWGMAICLASDTTPGSSRCLGTFDDRTVNWTLRHCERTFQGTQTHDPEAHVGGTDPKVKQIARPISLRFPGALRDNQRFPGPASGAGEDAGTVGAPDHGFPAPTQVEPVVATADH